MTAARVAGAWVLGWAVALVLVFTLGPQLQCAADVECARAGARWWHDALVLGAALAPGTAATLAWLRRRRGGATLDGRQTR